MTQTPLQKIATKRNWDIARTRGSIWHLVSVSRQHGCCPQLVADLESIGAQIETRIDTVWKEQRSRLKDSS